MFYIVLRGYLVKITPVLPWYIYVVMIYLNCLVAEKWKTSWPIFN